MINNLFKFDISPNDVAAIIIEPVQGEGGFYSAPVELLQELRKLCDEHGIVFIGDEIQTGFGRTGKMFNIEYSAVVGKQEMMDAAGAGVLGGTYGGSPVACAAALEVLDIIQEEDLII